MRKQIIAGSDRVRLEGVQRDVLPLGLPNEVWHEGCRRAVEEMREAAWSGWNLEDPLIIAVGSGLIILMPWSYVPRLLRCATRRSGVTFRLVSDGVDPCSWSLEGPQNIAVGNA